MKWRFIVWGASILLLLSPSIYLALRLGTIPQLGAGHDDGLNWTTAKSLAAGSGYRLLSLPDQPAQTKYPPLYALILSAVWRVKPDFPANLSLALALNWLMFGAFAIALERFLATAGVECETRLLLCGLLLSNGVVLQLVYTLYPDALFIAFVLGALIVLEKGRSPLAAGCLAALAFLSKGAALPLLIASPVVLLCQRRWKAAGWFVAGWFPWVVGWYVWTARHRMAGNDIVTIYYTSYFKLILSTTPFSALKAIVPMNLVMGVASTGSDLGMGALRLIPGVIASLAVLFVCLAGLRKGLRRGRLATAAAFAFGAAGMVVVFHAPPTWRYVLPVVPVLLAGAGLQLDWMVRGKFRWVMRVVAGVVFVVLLSGLSTQAGAQGKAEMDSLRPAYGWMAAHLPRDARVLSQKDPLLYLYTGLRGCRLELSPTHLFYSSDEDQRMYVVRHLEQYLAYYRLNYILESTSDGYGMSAEEEAEITRFYHSSPHVTAIYRDSFSTVYQVDVEHLAKATPGETFIPPRAADF